MPYVIDYKKIIGIISTIVYIGIGIACIVYSARVFIYSSDDPFENKKIDEPSKYFKKIQDIIQEEPNCQCDQRLYNERCSDEQISMGCYDIYLEGESPKDAYALRYLMDETKCKWYENSLIGQLKQNLNEVFKLKMNLIHIMSLILLITICLSFLFLILLIITCCGCVCCACCIESPMKFIICIPIFYIIGIVLQIINTGVFIALTVFYFTGDITAYADFLDCSNVNKDQFIKDFGVLEDLRSAFIHLLVLNIIGLILNCISNCTSKGDDSSNGYRGF